MKHLDSSCTNSNNKKKRGCYCILPPPKRKKSGKAAFLHLISASTTTGTHHTISLEADEPFTIGRSTRHCNLVFDDRRVSKQHCQILFDASLHKLYLLDGAFSSFYNSNKNTSSSTTRRLSLNGVFVNGVRVGKGLFMELSAGDEVLLACGNHKGLCGSRIRIGFIIQRIVFDIPSCKFNKRIFALRGYDSSPYLIGRVKSLLTRCRNILQSDDPVFYIRQCQKEYFEVSSLNSVGKDNPSHFDGVVQNKPCSNFVPLPSPGKNFYLNRLEMMHYTPFSHHPVVSLPELLYPVESISRMFIATFTSDILWFLSYCEIPCHLPVTIACHNTERCWSSDPDKRSFMPYPEFPNLVVVYPPFPESIAFGKDRKKQGIACHHPKLFVLQRQDSIRVIITSANLVANQWNRVTNTIWWQDFPRTSSPDYSSLFCKFYDGNMNKDSKPDFAAQLAGFVASLLTDVPSQAHWIVELTKYDFGGAKGHLIASVPGIHSYTVPSMIEIMQLLSANHKAFSVKFLGLVEASVVGLSHLFRTAADSNGARLKKLAAFLGKSCEKAYGFLEIVLIRNKNVPADANAVSVLVSKPNEFSEGDCVQLGFLPRNVAKWVSPLWDIGFFRFSGYVCPKEALAAALGGNSIKVQLILHVSQGPHFQDISRMMQPEHVIALCSLVASVRRCSGLWRLQEVLGQYRWPESLESDFIYGPSSIGSVNSQFLAAFSAASGKRSLQLFDSEESDPEWGCWSATQELKCPSIRIIFPTIERVKNACSGILPSKRILCFSERTWQRLRTADILHDAVPHPRDRLGHPMHVKVARRRFQSKMGAPSCGWVYCGSHNFSAAAWGRPISNPFRSRANGPEKGNSSLGLRLHICNYELGIIFIFPQTKGGSGKNCTNLDDVVLPFVVPAPKYGSRDRPATKQAMREALADLTEQEREKLVELVATEEMMEEIPDEEEEPIEATSYAAEEKEDEKAYVEQLWSQVDSSQSC